MTVTPSGDRTTDRIQLSCSQSSRADSLLAVVQSLRELDGVREVTL